MSPRLTDLDDRLRSLQRALRLRHMPEDKTEVAFDVPEDAPRQDVLRLRWSREAEND
jgi:hypothetical protein